MSHRSGAAPVGFSRFRTAGLPPAQRIAGWERINADGLVGVRVHPLGGAPLEAAAMKLALPRITLARIRGSAHSVRRGEDQIVQLPSAGAVLYFGLAGRGRFDSRDDREVVLPGQGVICDADQVFTRTFGDGLDALLLTVPRSALRTEADAAHLARPRRFSFSPGAADDGRSDPARRSAGALARELAAALEDARRSATPEWDALEARVLELVGGLVDSTAAPAGHAEAALAFIAEHAGERDLSAERIGAAVGLSLRQLSRVLAQAGTTVPRAVGEQRLAIARSLLADPQRGAMTMQEIAETAGFGSPEEFSRSYRRRFGLPPLRHRRLLIGQATA